VEEDRAYRAGGLLTRVQFGTDPTITLVNQGGHSDEYKSFTLGFSLLLGVANLASMTGQEKPKRGRPVTTDPAAVGLTALRLFSQRGIDKVTMDDVAEAAKISRSNLFRIYPSKAAVVWGGMHEFNLELERRIKENPETDVVKLLHTSWVQAMHVLDSSLETVRLRLKLIASSPEIYGWGHGQMEEARLLIETAAQKVSKDPLRSRIIASALISVSMAVLVWWAENNDPRTPSEVLDAGFRDFEKLFR
jgi:AcrR family transcriptional regulator